MKKAIKNILIAFSAVLIFAVSCKDEDLSPYIEPLGSAHGLGQFISGTKVIPNPYATPAEFYSQTAVDAAIFFTQGNQTTPVNYQLQWISIDSRVNISSIELYVEYNESYADKDRNPLIAAHGGAPKGPSYPAGKFWKTITPTAMRAPVSIVVTPADIYGLFKDQTFDYGNGLVNIFSANPQYDRSTVRFYGSRTYTDPSLPAGANTTALAADQFRIRWRLIGDDGTAYGSWSNSVCSETLGINCYGQWRVKI